MSFRWSPVSPASADTKAARQDEWTSLILIAGPNGAGKTTFAREYLSASSAPIVFVNADERHYKPIVDEWRIYDSIDGGFRLAARWED